MGFLGFMRFFFCCSEDQENTDVVHRYETIPEIVQRPNYETHWKYTAPSPSPSPSPSPLYVPNYKFYWKYPSPSPSPPPSYLPTSNKPVTTAKSTHLPQNSNKNVTCTTQKSSVEFGTESPHLVISLPKPQTNFHTPKSAVALLAPSSASKKKEKSLLTEQPKGKSPQPVNKPHLSSPKNKYPVPPISPVIQGSLCDTQKPIPSPETSTVRKFIHKPLLERETHRNEQEPFPSPLSSTSLPPSFKPPPLTPIETCSSASSQNTPKKNNYVWDPKDTTPLYSVPEDFKELIKKDIVPQVLQRCITPATYKNFFEALMYAEDYYCEKWSDYLLKDVKLELHKAAIYMKAKRDKSMTENRKNKNMNENGMKDKIFVAFRIDSIPERRPFLLSRDYVHLRPSGKEVEPFQGVLYRVVERNLVLAEFGDDFYLQHSSTRQYDVSFSFNRVCLKRSYQALSATTDTLLHNFLFPGQTPRVNMLDPPYFTPYLHNLGKEQSSAVKNILRLNNSPPFLVEGPLVLVNQGNVIKKSATYYVIQEVVQQIYRSSPGSRILINAPRNIICDWMMTSLMAEIPKSDIFRANAAFREKDEVDGYILPLCPFEGECFTCPPLNELQEFRVVLTTYMSSFRLHNQGISTGHFSHIFLVDASSIMEPEMIVSLSNLANQKTVVVVTGSGNCSGWVRSDIGREYGLKVSYFERLMKRHPYCSLDPLFLARISDNEDNLTDAFPKKTW